MVRSRRSVHFVPGGQRRMLDKALGGPADCVVLDLEDSVPADHKPQARSNAREWLEEDFGGRERIVRINPLDSPWWREDIEGTIDGGPDTYMLPKVRGAEDLARVAGVADALEQRHGLASGQIELMPIATETAGALLRIQEIAAAPRVCALAWGAEDLSADLGARRNRDDRGHLLEVFRYARVMTLLAAKASGRQAIDGVYTDFRDVEGLHAEAREAADMGFDGKLTIHPAQLEPVNEAFTPNTEQIREAEELLAAYAENERAGRGAFTFRGQMVDAPHLQRARSLLERVRPQAD